MRRLVAELDHTFSIQRDLHHLVRFSTHQLHPLILVILYHIHTANTALKEQGAGGAPASTPLHHIQYASQLHPIYLLYKATSKGNQHNSAVQLTSLPDGLMKNR